ncbi:hypothetical protein H2200_013086 [Cladophialophora chaetospira]|uniref:Uncharacterized protein n=1 Tax=Cladophialophora chaetospira TaxID=386627 RepID=A0AA38WWQ6_9EURO|nr:hypothetical protein H2200_013086 [Cladophialophora chaetospira]
MAGKPYERVATEILHGDDGTDGHHRSKVPWHTGVWARFPWTGSMSLLTVVACAAGALVVLLLSDGQPQERWQRATTLHSKYADIHLECPPPSVLLAIINAVANVCLLAAAGQGFAIYWWRRAVRGTTVKQLHQQWYFSNSALAFWCRPKYYSLAALVAIGTTISIADGILLQKATSLLVGSDGYFASTTLGVRSAMNYPLTGYVTNRNVTAPTEPYALLSWATQITLGGNIGDSASAFSGCDSGSCTFPLQSLGFSIGCEDTVNKVYNMSAVPVGENVLASSVGFAMSWAGDDKDYASITYTSAGISSDFAVEQDGLDGHCYVRYVKTVCELRPAIIELSNVSVANTSATSNARVSLPSWGFFIEENQLSEVSVVSLLDIREDGTETGSTIGGIQFALNDAFAMEAVMTLEKSGWVLDNWRMPKGNAFQFWGSGEAFQNATQLCFYEANDPLPDIVRALNQWTYLLSVNAPSSPENPYNWQWKEPIQYGPAQIPATKQGYGGKYSTNKGYTAAAVTSMLTCALLILPSYYGFWQLGRNVSLSPVEISHAFGAPILESTAIKGGIKHLKIEFGDMDVKYGVIGRGHRTRLGFAQPDLVDSLRVK